jgi:hypothetical protein
VYAKHRPFLRSQILKRIEKNPYLTADVLTPVGIIVVLFGYAFETMKMGNIIKNGLPSESFFPFLIFLLGLPFGIYLLVAALLEAKKKIAMQPVATEIVEDGSKEKASQGFMIKPAHKPLLITVLTFVFIILFQLLGYLITAPLYLFGFQLIYDDKLGNYVKKIIVALIVTVLVYALYVGCFNILFPEVWK